MKTSVTKNSTDQSCGKGRRLKASGYAINAKPGPAIGIIIKKYQGTAEIKIKKLKGKLENNQNYPSVLIAMVHEDEIYSSPKV